MERLSICSRWPSIGRGANLELSFPAKYGEHTTALLGEVGYDAAQVAALKQAGIIPA